MFFAYEASQALTEAFPVAASKRNAANRAYDRTWSESDQSTARKRIRSSYQERR